MKSTTLASIFILLFAIFTQAQQLGDGGESSISTERATRTTVTATETETEAALVNNTVSPTSDNVLAIFNNTPSSSSSQDTANQSSLEAELDKILDVFENMLKHDLQDSNAGGDGDPMGKLIQLLIPTKAKSTQQSKKIPNKQNHMQGHSSSSYPMPFSNAPNNIHYSRQQPANNNDEAFIKLLQNQFYLIYRVVNLIFCFLFTTFFIFFFSVLAICYYIFNTRKQGPYYMSSKPEQYHVSV